MKKIIIVSIVTIFSNFAFSQAWQKDMKLGTRLNYQMQSPSESSFDMGFLGFGIGIKASIAIPSINNLSFNPELSFLYRQLASSSYEEDDGYYKVEEERDFTEFAISVPLLLQYQIVDKLYLAAGLQLDIPFSSEVDWKYTENGETESGTDELKDRAALDFGIPLGAGYFIQENIALDLRIVIGLTDAADEGSFSFNQYGLGVTYFFR